VVIHPRHILLTRNNAKRLVFAPTLGRQAGHSFLSTDGKMLLPSQSQSTFFMR
jgi:hypothetical protein